MSEPPTGNADRRPWVVGVALLLILPALLPWLQFLAYYLVWPLAWISSSAHASAYHWVTSFLAPEYLLRILILMGLQAILALGLNLVSGFCGLLDLGYVAFYCVGAYTTAILTMHFGLDFWTSALAAALLAGLAGVIRGFPTLTLAGDYYAIVTFGFAELVVLASKNWTEWTGGAAGFPGIRAPALPFLGWSLAERWEIAGVVFQPPVQHYYLMVAIFVVCLAVVLRVRDSRLGRAWFAIREDEIAAESMGIDLAWTKTLCFALSAAMGGLAGAFFAGFDRNLHWTSFQFMESVMILCAVVLGGLGNVSGVLYGTVVLVGLTEVLRPFGVWRWIVYGAVMILVMRFRPEGLFPRGRKS